LAISIFQLAWRFARHILEGSTRFGDQQNGGEFYQQSFTQNVATNCSRAVEVTEKTMSLSNSLGLLGRKVGMMRLFTDDGDAVPVTVVDVSNNRVTQVKTQENDGYVALQVTFGARKALRA
jgi:hypothetical protein